VEGGTAHSVTASYRLSIEYLPSIPPRAVVVGHQTLQRKHWGCPWEEAEWYVLTDKDPEPFLTADPVQPAGIKLFTLRWFSELCCSEMLIAVK
jgi:hypothetical protein